MAERDIVRVDWTDTVGRTRWGERAQAAQELRPASCRSWGIVLRETEDYITVAGSIDDTLDNVNDVNCIPRVAIRNITVLKKAP